MAQMEPRDDSFESLDDLFLDAELARAAKNAKQPRSADPSMRNALDAATKKMRELYTLPENWKRNAGVALIDKGTNTLVGNFSEYLHVSLQGTRKLLREHAPIAIDRTEVVEGYLGDQTEFRLSERKSWTEVRQGVADLLFDEMQVGCPQVKVIAYLRLGALQRVELDGEYQFASSSGAVLLILPAGTNVLEQLSTDSRHQVRKAVGL